MSPGTVANRVSEICGRKRWNISRLSKEADISYPTAHGLWHGTSKGITFEVMGKVALALGVDVGDLFVIVNNGNEPPD